MQAILPSINLPQTHVPDMKMVFRVMNDYVHQQQISLRSNSADASVCTK